MPYLFDNEYVQLIMNADRYIQICWGVIGVVMFSICIISTKGITKKTRIGVSIIMFFIIFIIFVSTVFIIQVWSFYVPNTSFFDDRYVKIFKNIHPLMGMGIGIIGVMVLAYLTSIVKKNVKEPKIRVGVIILMSGPLFALAIPFVEMAIIGIFILVILGGVKGRNRPVSGSVVADAMLFEGDAEKARLARKFRNFLD